MTADTRTAATADPADQIRPVYPDWDHDAYLANVLQQNQRPAR